MRAAGREPAQLATCPGRRSAPGSPQAGVVRLDTDSLGGCMRDRPCVPVEWVRRRQPCADHSLRRHQIGNSLAARQRGRGETDRRVVVEVVGFDSSTSEHVPHLGVHGEQIVIQVQRGPGARRVPSTSSTLGERRIERIRVVGPREAQPDVAVGKLRRDHGAMRVRSNVSANSSRSRVNSPASATSSRVLPPSASTGRRTTAAIRSRLTHWSSRSVAWPSTAT